MKKHIVLILILLLFRTIVSYAQIDNHTTTPTPTAASLGQFGQISISPFTGQPDINVPIFNFKSRDLSIPIQLNYRGGGVRPSDHASWVGLGWALQAGGAITRIQNDLPDELIDYHLFPNTQKGFFYNYSTLASSNWSSSTMMTTVQAANENSVFFPTTSTSYQRIDYAPDEFQFNFLGMSGSLIMGQDGLWKIKSKQGLNFTVSTEIGPYAVWEPNTNTQLGSPNFPSLIRNCLTHFILTGPDGTKYYFGTSPASTTHNFTSSWIYGYFSTPDSAAVEFTRVGAGSGDASSRDGGTVATTWYLTKIQSITGDVITLTYTRDGPQVIVTTSTFGTFSECPYCFPHENLVYGAGDDAVILDGVTLSSITGVNGVVNFNKSQANVMDYSFLGVPTAPQSQGWSSTTQNGLFWAYTPEIFQGYSNPYGPSVKSIFMKLDNMSINDNNNSLIKSFSFNYTTGNTNRLFLNSLMETGTDGSSLPPYTFNYNNIAGLNNVPYNTVQVDHWGYYNANAPFTNLFSNISVPAPTTINPFTQTGTAVYQTFQSSKLAYSSAFDATFNATYTSNRSPVGGPMAYGILTQIGYPTGGNTQFTWEPNTYSKYMNLTVTPTTPGNLVVSAFDNGSSSIGAGLRISQIVSQAGPNSPPLSKSYYYFRDYVNNNYLSSGVLNSPLPSYVNSYTSVNNYLYRAWSNSNVMPGHYTDGGIITYTNVQEINNDGSYKTYTYTNQDNGYQDKSGANYLFSNYATMVAPGSLQQLGLNSMELERGLLLNESSYGVGSHLLNSKTYQYNNDLNRFNNAIKKYLYSKKFSLDGESFSFDNDGFLVLGSTNIPVFWGDITAALSTYIHYPYLKSVTETQYDQSGQNPVTSTTNFTYDNYRNRKSETFVNSKNETIITNYNYPTDVISGLPTSASTAQSAMVTAGITSTPLEKTTTNNGSQTFHSRIDYQLLTNGSTQQIVPATYNLASTGVLETRQQYNKYDAYSNILEEQKPLGPITAYLWGYNSTYPVARVVGIDNATITNMINPNTINNPADDATMRAELNKIRLGLASTNAPVNTLTYKPLVGITSQTDAQGRTNFFNYDGQNRLSYILDNDFNVAKRYDYNYSGQNPNPNILGYGNDAMMATFTKIPACPGGFLTPTLFYVVIAGKYTSYVDKATANQLAQNDLLVNGQAGANALACIPAPSCTFSMLPGFSSPTNNIQNNGTSVSGYIVFYYSGTMVPNVSYAVATINGTCRPSATRTINYTTSGRNWTITIYPSGQMSCQFDSGGANVPPNSTINLNSINYNL